MHFRGFDLNLLIALDALLRERNVTRAAERVFVSQPTMSLALQRLREYFSDPLLVRVGREFELSPRGLSLVGPVRDALLKVASTLGTQPAFDPASARRDFTISLPDFITQSLGARVLKQVLGAAPTLTIAFKHLSKTAPSRLESGELDLFIAPDDPVGLGLETFSDSLCRAELMSVRWMCAAAEGHPLLNEQLTRERLLECSHVCFQMPEDRAVPVEIGRRLFGVKVDVRASTHSMIEIPFLLSGTNLVAILPEELGMQLASTTGIVLREIPEDVMPLRRIAMFWHRRNESEPSHAWLRKVIMDCVTAPAATNS